MTAEWIEDEETGFGMWLHSDMCGCAVCDANWERKNPRPQIFTKKHPYDAAPTTPNKETDADG